MLVLAPHTDDGELGCGATISKLLDRGRTVYYVAFSTCEESVPDPFPSDILHTEVRDGTGELGIPPDHLIVKDYRVRRFPSARQEILEDMVTIAREIRPDLVFCPSSFDIHQDHQVIFAEAQRAFKTSSILGYEFMWNNFAFGSTFFSLVTEEHLQRKLRALACYQSQRHRLQDLDKLVFGQAGFRGIQVGSEYAEAFEAIRWIME